MNTTHARQCQGKKSHRTHDHARVALRRTIELTGDTSLVFYRCEHCERFHIGHPPRDEQRRVKAQRLVNLIERAVRDDARRSPSRPAQPGEGANS